MTNAQQIKQTPWIYTWNIGEQKNFEYDDASTDADCHYGAGDDDGDEDDDGDDDGDGHGHVMLVLGASSALCMYVHTTRACMYACTYAGR